MLPLWGDSRDAKGAPKATGSIVDDRIAAFTSENAVSLHQRAQ